MTIKVGDRLPETTFRTMGADGTPRKKTAEVFAGKKVALFAVPGAYTPHLSQAAHAGLTCRTTSELKKKGFDVVACTSTNDIFVLTNWAKDSKADGKILMLADGSAEFAKKIGLDIDLFARGMGVRSRRYSMIVEDGVVKVAQRRGGAGARQVERRNALFAGVKMSTGHACRARCTQRSQRAVAGSPPSPGRGIDPIYAVLRDRRGVSPADGDRRHAALA